MMDKLSGINILSLQQSTGLHQLLWGIVVLDLHLAEQMTEKKLVELMEGVEDIPAPVMHEGLEWSWETFPEYLDALEHGHEIQMYVPSCLIFAVVCIRG